MKKTIVVNLIGGPGSGKSSMMADIFACLKWSKIDCEICTEFAKELVWEERYKTFKDELYILAKQAHRLFICDGKVDVVITDRPLIMSIPYNEMYGNKANTKWNEHYNGIVIETFNLYNNLNIIIDRVIPYHTNGRNETYEAAIAVDAMNKKLLNDLNIPYHVFKGCEESINDICDLIKQHVLNESVQDEK